MPSGCKPRAKIIVIACNTATAWGLDDVRRYLASIGDGTRVVGVIEAGVRATLAAAGGIAGAEGSCTFALTGEEDQLDRAAALVKAMRG